MPYKIKNIIPFMKLMIKQYQKDSLPAQAAQITYFLLLAFFPFLIFIVSLISYTNLTEFADKFYTFEILPIVVSDLILSVVNNAVENQSYTLLSVGVILAIWSSSSAVLALMVGICRAYGKENRSYIKLRILSIIYTIIFTLIVILSFTLLVLGEQIGRYLFSIAGIENNLEIAWDIARYVGATFALIVLFILLFVGIPCCKLKIKEVLPGALFTTVGWIILSTGFSYYINNFTKLSYTYGSLGAVFALLLWLYWSCLIVLLGNMFNAVRMQNTTQ